MERVERLYSAAEVQVELLKIRLWMVRIADAHNHSHGRSRRVCATCVGLDFRVKGIDHAIRHFGGEPPSGLPPFPEAKSDNTPLSPQGRVRKCS